MSAALASISLLDVLAETERALVDALALEPLALPPELARAEGEWKGAPVRIETTAWRGPAIRYARFARIAGAGLEIGNALCLPRHELPLPIFGADLVSLGARAGTMLAADLSPVLPAGEARDAQLASLARRRMAAGAEALPPGGALPAWCARWFSAHALYTRPDAAALPAAVEAYRLYPDEMARLARPAAPAPALAPLVREAQDGYARAHREDDKGLGLLAKMFGAGWAARYLHEVLFPPATGSLRAA